MQQDNPATVTGSIRATNAERSFGFIRGDDGHDYFFHKSAVQTTDHGTDAFNDLAKGDLVSFQAKAAPKGPRAEVVTKI
jgi:cold shock CspA family protein